MRSIALSGQVPVGQVAVGQVGRGHQGLVGDGHGMVRLVAVAQALQDLDGERHVRLLHLDGLEPALEGGVLLQVLAVLVDGGGTDGLQLAPGQHRLEDRGGVDGAFGRAGTHQGVELVDEQHDVAAGADLLQDLLEALLEIAAVAAAGDEGAEVERVELLAGQRLGDLVGHDPLGEALDDGRLAHAGLTDEDRVVLGAPGQHLHDPFDLLLAPDDRVELVVPGQRGEVAAELVEHGGTGRGVGLLVAGLAATDGLLALVAREQLDDLLADPGQVGAEALQDLGGHALALAHQSEQHVLGADVAVAELQRLAQRQLEDLLGPGGERRGARSGRCRPGRSSPRPSRGRPPGRRPSDSSALAATPSPSWIRPRRMCSVPMKLWLSRRASSCANTRTRRARSVNRSNTPPPPSAVSNWKPKSTGADVTRTRSPAMPVGMYRHRQSDLSSVASERRRPPGTPRSRRSAGPPRAPARGVRRSPETRSSTR